MATQWERLLKNSGTWVGSFTQLSPAGDIRQDTPTIVALKPQDGGNQMRQEIRKMPAGEAPQETILEYRSLGKGVLFLENGAFSQGSIQWSPVAEFGAELGFIEGTERLRVVQLFQRERTLSSITLIREYLEGTQPRDRPPLSPEQLLGVWEGEAVSLSPDLWPDATQPTRLEIRQASPGQIHQTLQFGQHLSLQSTGHIAGHHILFDQGSQPVTVHLLPGGASVTCPQEIVGGQPFFLEAGWLIQPNLRQRLIRSYDEKGSWTQLTLVTERKVG